LCIASTGVLVASAERSGCEEYCAASADGEVVVSFR
jgi:hypothetical protein